MKTTNTFDHLAQSNKARQRSFSAISVMLLGLLLILSPKASAQYTYSASGGEISITGYTGAETNLVIPAMIEGLPVKTISNEAFYSNTKLATVVIPAGVTSIGNEAFAGCDSLASVMLPGSVSIIGRGAFYFCTSLTSFTIPTGVTTISDYAFSGCFRLTRVTIPDSVASIGDGVFQSCASLASITIPNSVTSIRNSAFEGCTSLASVMIPESARSIGFLAFYNCVSLANIAIPDSVTSIGNDAFTGCTSLNAITVDAVNSSYRSVDGVLFSKIGNRLIVYPGGKTGSYTIPDGVTGIADSAFAYCTNLTSVTIPSSVTSVGSGVFESCASLASITIPDSVTSIEDRAFHRCTSLTNVAIPSSVTSIKDKAFGFCTSLASVTIPNSVTRFGDLAFYQCSSLEGVYFHGNAPKIESWYQVFYGAEHVVVYYLPEITGWGARFAGRPAVAWNPQALTPSPNFGIDGGNFDFTIIGTPNIIVVVETSTSLSTPNWTPVETNTLTGGSSFFSDPQWTNFSSRFYRFRLP